MNYEQIITNLRSEMLEASKYAHKLSYTLETTDGNKRNCVTVHYRPIQEIVKDIEAVQNLQIKEAPCVVQS